VKWLHYWLGVCIAVLYAACVPALSQVPSDANIVLSVLKEEQAAQMEVAVSPPCLAADLAGHTHKGTMRRMLERAFHDLSSLAA